MNKTFSIPQSQKNEKCKSPGALEIHSKEAVSLCLFLPPPPPFSVPLSNTEKGSLKNQKGAMGLYSC